MGLEAVSFIADFVETNPAVGDQRHEGDDHIRRIKSALKATFPGMGGRSWRTQVKGSGYTVVVGDNMTLIQCSAAVTLALTAAATLGNGHMILVHAEGGDVVIAPDGAEEVNGAADLTLTEGSAALLLCDGTGFACFGMTVGVAVTLTDEQTLTNKTLTAPELNNPVVTNPDNVDQTLTDQATVAWDMDLGQVGTLTLGGNRTMGAPTHLKVGTYILHVIQDATGSRTITWNGVFKWQSGVAPELSTGAGDHDILCFICDGTNLYGNAMLDVG